VHIPHRFARLAISEHYAPTFARNILWCKGINLRDAMLEDTSPDLDIFSLAHGFSSLLIDSAPPPRNHRAYYGVQHGTHCKLLPQQRRSGDQPITVSV